jgi:hypothetical protein
MMPKQWTRISTCAVLAAGLLGLAATARAGDDTARFYGTWKTSFPYNGQMVTMISVHDASGFKNYVVLPSGNTPAGDGQFSAANGRWTASGEKPNDSGTYHFLGDNTVVCTNAAGQAVTWRRENLSRPGVNAEPPVAPPAPANAAPPADDGFPPSSNPATNLAIAAFNRRDNNTAWREFMAAAQQGDAEAQAGVGAMLFHHLNPPGTGYYAQCEKWLTASANQGNAKGMDFLAQYYFADGKAIAGGINPGINNSPIPPALQAQAERRFAQARQMFERASALGDRYAMGNLAILLDAGIGGPRDSARAAQLRASVARGPDADFTKRVTQDPESLALLLPGRRATTRMRCRAPRSEPTRAMPRLRLCWEKLITRVWA